jgi:DNA-binding beta-propeller fold protein YncE
MKLVSKIFLVIILLAQQQVIAQSLDQMQAKSVRLPNGWSLTPVGRSMPLGDLPLNMILSKSGKLLAVTNNGQGVQSIQLIDPQKEQLLDSVVIAKSWYGLAFSSDEKFLYAAGGHDNWILKYAIQTKNWLFKTAWFWEKDGPTKLDHQV